MLFSLRLKVLFMYRVGRERKEERTKEIVGHSREHCFFASYISVLHFMTLRALRQSASGEKEVEQSRVMLSPQILTNGLQLLYTLVFHSS